MLILGKVIHIHKITNGKKKSKETDESIYFWRSASIKASLRDAFDFTQSAVRTASAISLKQSCLAF